MWKLDGSTEYRLRLAAPAPRLFAMRSAASRIRLTHHADSEVSVWVIVLRTAAQDHRKTGSSRRQRAERSRAWTGSPTAFGGRQPAFFMNCGMHTRLGGAGDDSEEARDG